MMWIFLALAIPPSTDKYDRLSDADLVREFQKSHDAQLVLVLLRRYQAGLVARYRRYAHDDLGTQETVNELLLLLYERLKRVKDPRSVRGLLFTIVQNHLIDLDRRHKLHRSWEDREVQQDQERVKSVAWTKDWLTQQMDLNRFRDLALAKLNESEKLVLLPYLSGKSYREIMDEQGLSFNQVRGGINRAIKRLREDPEVEGFFD
ncbi:MAG: sigma-70 family RNA polymerase sigma factor [Bacteroidota bacterium]